VDTVSAVPAGDAASSEPDRRIFRWMNEHVRETQKEWPISVYDLICECGDIDCLAVLSIDRTAYEQIAATPAHFVVLPGHERLEFEHVVETRKTHVVVRPRQLVRVSGLDTAAGRSPR
jgi:hypothetical protein